MTNGRLVFFRAELRLKAVNYTQSVSEANRGIILLFFFVRMKVARVSAERIQFGQVDGMWNVCCCCCCCCWVETLPEIINCNFCREVTVLVS